MSAPRLHGKPWLPGRDGVAARCAGCQVPTIAYNTAREIPAAWKALYDRISNRPPAVSSPADQQIAAALRD
jgi:hypothetical protein